MNTEKEMQQSKKAYICESCGEKFYITIKPKFCPICGGKDLFMKSKLTADKYLAELKELIPQMEEVAKHMTELYVKYLTAHERLKLYACRGIICKEDIPSFALPNMSKSYHDSRKKRVERRKENEE